MQFFVREAAVDFPEYKNETPLDQLVPECMHMATFALESGLKIPAAMMERLYLIQQIHVRFQQGLPFPVGDGFPANMPNCASELSTIHARLCDIIAPARPHTILLLAKDKETAGKFHFLGPVPLIRRMMGLAFFSLVAFLAISLLPGVGDPDGLSFVNNKPGIMLINFAFLIAAAAMGSSFAALYQANKYVTTNTFDPKYEQSYWNRHLLGIMAGLILAFFIPIESFAEEDGNLRSLGKPLLAILGGFSSAAVYRILSRLVGAMESLLKGDPKNRTILVEEQARANSEQRILRIRMGLANQLSGLRGQMGAATDPDLKKGLDQILHELFGNQNPTALKDPQEPDPSKEPAPPSAAPPPTDPNTTGDSLEAPPSEPAANGDAPTPSTDQPGSAP